MRYLSALCLSIAVCFTANVDVKAQGDSDPGFSTTGAMRNNSGIMIGEEEFENQRTHFSLSNTFATGENHVVLDIPTVEVRVPMFGLTSGGYFDVRLPFYSAKGDLGKVWGVGDMVVTYTHMFQGVDNWTFQGTAGLNIGMGTATATDGTRPLPMIYQSSQGSTDVIIGGSAMFKQYITVAAAYQQPFVRYNQNAYDRFYEINDTVYSSTNYPVGSKLYRNGDVMLRVEGHYGGKRAGISGGPLAIYHLRNDLYTDRSGYIREIVGSEGLTLNLVGNVYMRFGRTGSFKLDCTGSIPVVTRDVRPDGLTRNWMITPRFTYFFGTSKNNYLLF